MWFFMNACYLLSFLTFLFLGMAMLQSFFPFDIISATPVTFIILTSIIYFLTETLIIFFFVGTGVSIKEFTLANRLQPDYHKKSIALKMKIYPPTLLNIMLMIVLFVSLGAVDTGRLPRLIYQVFFLICLIHFAFMKRIQHQCFRDNTANILAMSGIEKRF